MQHYVSPTNGFGQSYGYYPRPGTGFALHGLRGGIWGETKGDAALRGALLGGALAIAWYYMGGEKQSKPMIFNIASALPVMGTAAGVVFGPRG